MSRSVLVWFRAALTFVAVLAFLPWSPVAGQSADATVNIEAPLHEAPDPGSPLVALLPVGTEVMIEGPPVDEYYPVSVSGVTGWLVGETLSVVKDVATEEATADSGFTASGEEVASAQTSDDSQTGTEPTPTAAEPAAAEAAEPAATEPAQPVATDTVEIASEPASPDATATESVAAEPTDTAPADAQTLVTEPAPDPAVASALDAELTATSTAAATTDATETDTASEPVSQPPVDSATAAEVTMTPTDMGASPTPAAQSDSTAKGDADTTQTPAPQPEVTPEPTPDPAPQGPASSLVNMPVFSGPGPDYALIFTVPAGSAVEQTGQLENGYVSVRYKEVVGWSARDQLGDPIASVDETLDAKDAEPVDTRTPRPGSGVAYTVVDLSLRAGPSADEEPVAVIPAGSRVVLTGVMEYGFQRVNFKDQIGWVSNEYLSTPADPEPEADKGGRDGKQYSEDQIIHIIYDAADRYGQSRTAMLRVARCESNLDPYAVNPSGSYGLFQFIRPTWKSTPFGDQDIFDPKANANAAGWMWSQGRKSEWVCQ
ncbi:MAG: SH3 domain-containing protein [Thermomicrobiales bacterium]